MHRTCPHGIQNVGHKAKTKNPQKEVDGCVDVPTYTLSFLFSTPLSTYQMKKSGLFLKPFHLTILISHSCKTCGFEKVVSITCFSSTKMFRNVIFTSMG
jgi:hypothetical protein